MKALVEKLVGQRALGTGECYDLADGVLKEAGGHSADHYGTITADADYIWGKKRDDLSSIQPQDILQFRDHKITIETKTKTRTTRPDGSWEETEETLTETHKRGHHTAIVLATNADGTLTVAEQHVIDPATRKLSHFVRQNKLAISSSEKKLPTKTTMRGRVKIEKDVTITTTVTGAINAYDPQVKDDTDGP